MRLLRRPIVCRPPPPGGLVMNHFSTAVKLQVFRSHNGRECSYNDGDNLGYCHKKSSADIEVSILRTSSRTYDTDFSFLEDTNCREPRTPAGVGKHTSTGFDRRETVLSSSRDYICIYI